MSKYLCKEVLEEQIRKVIEVLIEYFWCLICILSAALILLICSVGLMPLKECRISFILLANKDKYLWICWKTKNIQKLGICILWLLQSTINSQRYFVIVERFLGKVKKGWVWDTIYFELDTKCVFKTNILFCVTE